MKNNPCIDSYNLSRFIDAQNDVYDIALFEIAKGQKESHWMWYIFPQVSGLGESETSLYYGISGLDEAKEYCENELLHSRYLECCNALLIIKNKTARAIFGYIDAMKLKSSLTLFYEADLENRSLYGELLSKFYDG